TCPPSSAASTSSWAKSTASSPTAATVSPFPGRTKRRPIVSSSQSLGTGCALRTTDYGLLTTDYGQLKLLLPTAAATLLSSPARKPAGTGAAWMRVRIVNLDESVCRQTTLCTRYSADCLDLRRWGPRIRLGCRFGRFAQFRRELNASLDALLGAG